MASSTEVLEERISQMEGRLRDAANERDRRYEERFKAQELALDKALAASRTTFASTLIIVGVAVSVLLYVLSHKAI